MEYTVQTPNVRTICYKIDLDNDAVMADITRAIKMIRGIVAIRPVRKELEISPVLKRKIARAEKNYKEGKTIKFNSVSEMDAYLDTL